MSSITSITPREPAWTSSLTPSTITYALDTKDGVSIGYAQIRSIHFEDLWAYKTSNPTAFHIQGNAGNALSYDWCCNKEEENRACKQIKRSLRLHHKGNTLKEAIEGFTEKVSSVKQCAHCENFPTDADCLPCLLR